LKNKIEKVLQELDGIFKSRDRTLEVLLGLWLETNLPMQIGHSEEANTMSLCDRFLAWRSEEKVKSLSKIVGIEDEVPVKFSGKAMEHLAGLGLLRSDLPEDFREDSVLGIDGWEAGRIQAQRMASEGDCEGVATIAKERIRRLGGSGNDLLVIDGFAKKATSDELYRYSEAQNILTAMLYAEVRVTSDPFLIGKNLLRGGMQLFDIVVKRYITEMQIDSEKLQQAGETTKKLRAKLKRKGRLDDVEVRILEDAEKNVGGITARFNTYQRNLDKRLEKYKNGEKRKGN